MSRRPSPARERVQLVEVLERRVLMTTTPNDPSFSSEWGLSAINAPGAWDTTTGSTAVTVAGIDTGVDYTHPDLYLNVWLNQDEIPTAALRTLRDADRDGLITFWDLNSRKNRGKVADVNGNRRIDAGDVLASTRSGGWSDGVDNGKNGYADDLVGWDFAGNDNDPMDYDGHGTHTAGTIAASGNDRVGVTGVAWKAQLMAVKIFDDGGESATSRTIATAIRYSADNGAAVSNNSWGSSSYSSAVYNAIAYAGDRGQTFVVAAGNDSLNLDSRFANDYAPEYDLDNIVAVGATRSNGTLATYSNYGSATVDLLAPGSGVYSTSLDGGYRSMSGTSMAAPHVAGAIVLLLSENPDLTPAQIKALLVKGADQSASLDATSAADGELNVANALANRTGTRYTPPATDSSDDAATQPPGAWRRRSLFSDTVIDALLA